MKNKKLVIFNEKFWADTEESVFKEQVNPKTGEKIFILKGMMLPFGKVSRNDVLYNKESIIDKHKELIGRSLIYNHNIDGVAYPVGHFINSYLKEDGWYYEADVDPNEKDLIRKLERGDLRHVSIQLIAENATPKEANGQGYTEAIIGDVIEGSIVPAPGFLQTTASFKEKFNQMKREGNTKVGDLITVKMRPELGRGKVIEVTEDNLKIDFGNEGIGNYKEDEIEVERSEQYGNAKKDDKKNEDITTGNVPTQVKIAKKKKEEENIDVDKLTEIFISELGEAEIESMLN